MPFPALGRRIAPAMPRKPLQPCGNRFWHVVCAGSPPTHHPLVTTQHPGQAALGPAEGREAGAEVGGSHAAMLMRGWSTVIS